MFLFHIFSVPGDIRLSSLVIIYVVVCCWLFVRCCLFVWCFPRRQKSYVHTHTHTWRECISVLGKDAVAVVMWLWGRVAYVIMYFYTSMDTQTTNIYILIQRRTRKLRSSSSAYRSFGEKKMFLLLILIFHAHTHHVRAFISDMLYGLPYERPIHLLLCNFFCAMVVGDGHRCDQNFCLRMHRCPTDAGHSTDWRIYSDLLVYIPKDHGQYTCKRMCTLHINDLC